MDFNIPLRAKNEKEFSQLKKIDKEIVAYAVLFGADNQTAFMRFHPEYCLPQGGMNQAGKTEAKHFWSYGKTREYREAYEATLAEFLGRKGTAKASVQGNGEVDDSRKEKALKALLNQAMGLVEEDTNLDADSLKTISDIFSKLKLIKQDEEIAESPRRYLPIRCKSECQYRIFCEKAIENGEIENECLYCKALSIAQEHGYEYDPTTNLSIPQKDA